MKLNWGSGIALFYSFFVLALLYQVYCSTQYDNSLVSDHYYADDLNYQAHYNKLANAGMLEEDLKIWNKLQKAEVELQFPVMLSGISGEVYFFCPSDSRQDFRLPVQVTEAGTQRIPTKGLKKGLWKVKVDWQAEGKAFYKEQPIIF